MEAGALENFTSELDSDGTAQCGPPIPSAAICVRHPMRTMSAMERQEVN